MNEVSVCTTETQILSCVLFTFCMSLNFHWSKKWYELFTSCNVFCMQAWHFRNFQIRASLCSPCHYIFRAHITKNLKLSTLAHCRVLFITARMFTRHTLNVQLSPLNCECSSQTALTSDGFHPVSSCPLPVGWNPHCSVVENTSRLGLFVLSTGHFTFIPRVNSPICTTFHRKVRKSLHQSTERNLHQHLWQNVTSHRTEDRAGPSYCVWRVFYGSVKIIAAFTKAPYWTYCSGLFSLVATLFW